jgi:hypothetical protein
VPIFKRVAQWIEMPARFVDRVSEHSTRVGATQDLAALDIDLAAITHARSWKSTGMHCSMRRRSIRLDREWRERRRLLAAARRFRKRTSIAVAGFYKNLTGTPTASL